MDKTKLIFVGGFLGAGKTSLLYQAANVLRNRGESVGLITNDQTTNLVDTTILSGHEMPVAEVSGSCFCCNFPGLVGAVESVAGTTHGGITIAEPVGSCTDLSATIMQPMKDHHQDLASLAPLTVLVDPERLRGILDQTENIAAYIATKQLDEADIILINKIDVLQADDLAELMQRTQKQWPQAKVMAASAKEGTGVEAWLEEVLRPQDAGKNLAVVDYDLYADGEAAYGWLNATFTFAGPGPAPSKTAEQLLDLLEKGLAEADAGIGHVKFFFREGGRQWLGNLTGMADHKVLREEEYAASADGNENCSENELVVNARAETGPKELQDIVLAAVDTAFAEYTFTGTEIRTLIPGRPDPTYHYDEVI